jgi:hypothetical protein
MLPRTGSYPIFLANAYPLYDGTRTVTMYGSVADLPSPSTYAPFVHRWVHEHVTDRLNTDWGVRVMSYRVGLIVREHYISSILFNHSEQQFRIFSEVEEVMDGPMAFPGIENHDWSCLLREAL